MRINGWEESAVLAEPAAREIRDGFQAHPNKWEKRDGREHPVNFTIRVPSIQGESVSRLDNGYPGSFDNTLSYHPEVKIRKGCGIIIVRLETDSSGNYTGEATVQAACDDFDL